MPKPEMEYPTDSHPDLVERYLGVYEGTKTEYKRHETWSEMDDTEVSTHTSTESGITCKVARTGPTELKFESASVNFNIATDLLPSNVGHYDFDTTIFHKDEEFSPCWNKVFLFKIDYSKPNGDTLYIYESDYFFEEEVLLGSDEY